MLLERDSRGGLREPRGEARPLLDPGPVSAAPPGQEARPRRFELGPTAAPAPLSFGLAAKLVVATVLTYTFLFNFSVVRGNSMSPGIHDGDRILIDHVSYLFGEVQRGDVVVLKYPLDPHVDYIKRVIGLPGDELVLDRGNVWVNGVLLEEPYVKDRDFGSRMSVHVKPAHYFVLGDNRVRSSDSRDFGLVPMDYVRGKVEVRVWPPSRFGRLGTVAP